MHRVRYWTHNWLIIKLNNESVTRHLGEIAGDVIDLGCGIKPYEPEIGAVAAQYLGLDWTDSYHLLCADIVADISQPLPLADAIANTVVSFQVLEHLREPQTMLDEAFRILRAGGRIVITVPFQWWIHEQPHDYFRFTRYGLEYMLTKAGFVHVHTDEVSGFWTMWFLKLNYQMARLVRGPVAVRWLLQTIFVPIWWIDQILAPLLDRVWTSPQETVGYVAVARKE